MDGLPAGALVVTRHDDPYKWEKSAWGPGPWDDEPDRVEWREPTMPGLVCLVARGPMGNWCGYVAVPPGHPAHGADYNDVEVSVHGGLTYAERCQAGPAAFVCHVPAPGEPDDVWWLGFDCGHAFDYSPAMEARMRMSSRLLIEKGRAKGDPEFAAWLKERAEAATYKDPPLHNLWMFSTYRPVQYAMGEVRDLAQQLFAQGQQPERTRLLAALRRRERQLFYDGLEAT